MDSNLMSCPTCGHSVGNAAGACAYCGAIMSEDQPPPTEETGAVDRPLSVDASSPSTSPETSDNSDVSEPVDETAALRDAQATATGPEESPEQTPETNATAPEIVPPAKSGAKPNLEDLNSQAASLVVESETKNEAEMVSLPLKAGGETDTGLTADTVVETAAGTEDLVAKEIVLEKPAADSEGLARQGEPVESILEEAQSGSAVEEIQLAAQSNPAGVTVDEAGESEILGEDIIELAEIQNIEEELEKTSPSESLGDTILLEEVVDEVQPDSGKESDKIDDSARESFDEKALKIEKAPAGMTVAVPKQKESLDEDQKTQNKDRAASGAEALKKPKAALAKAHAVKKQKMIFAKTAALKRKKAAQAQALKKQEDARAVIEKAPKNKSAAANTAASEKSRSTRSPDASSKLGTLLERYKGRAVGINYDNSADIREAQVVEANGEYFSVLVKDKNLKYSYPLKTILTVIEGKDGVEVGESEKKSKFNAVIKVHPLVLF